ncbi:hypothetical protein [Shinella zoogloeoides]
MTQTMIGLDYEGVPCLKITKGDIDPGEEPDANVGSFLYNSKWAADLRLSGMDFTIRKAVDTMEPPGSTNGTYTKRTIPYSISNNVIFIRNSRFPSLLYDLPLSDMKTRDLSTGRFIGVRFNETLHHYDRRGGNWQTISSWLGWGKDITASASSTYLAYGTYITEDFTGVAVEGRGKQTLVAWNLPGDESPIFDGAPGTAPEGTPAIIIDNAGARVAKPGYDVNNITRPTQLALDTANSPTKIIGAADIECPSGLSSYDLGINIPTDAVADVFAYQGSTITFPASPIAVLTENANQFGVEYSFSGSFVQFYNPYGACRVRFMVYAVGTDAPTAGDNDVLRQFEVGGENVVQILRPGAGENPNFSDIVIDSRWPCIQILKQGYIPVGTGELKHVVDFNGSGCFPIVKWMTVHGARGTFWSKGVSPPKINVCGAKKTVWTTKIGGDTTYCEIEPNKATFYTFRGNPVEMYYADLQDLDYGIISTTSDPMPILGIRYYILGIPA